MADSSLSSISANMAAILAVFRQIDTRLESIETALNLRPSDSRMQQPQQQQLLPQQYQQSVPIYRPHQLLPFAPAPVAMPATTVVAHTAATQGPTPNNQHTTTTNNYSNPPGAANNANTRQQQRRQQQQQQLHIRERHLLQPAPHVPSIIYPAPKGARVSGVHPAVVPLEAPPEGYPITSRATMQAELDAWTLPRGYSLRLQRTRRSRLGQRLRIVCFRWGKPRALSRRQVERFAAATASAQRTSSKPPSGPGARRRSSIKCQCPFQFELSETGHGTDRFVVRFTNRGKSMFHNHQPGVANDPRQRAIPEHMKAEVDGWLLEGRPLVKILEELTARGLTHVTYSDLWRRRAKMAKTGADGEVLLPGPVEGETPPPGMDGMEGLDGDGDGDGEGEGFDEEEDDEDDDDEDDDDDDNEED